MWLGLRVFVFVRFATGLVSNTNLLLKFLGFSMMFEVDDKFVTTLDC